MWRSFFPDILQVQKAVNDFPGKNKSGEKVNKAMTAIAGIGKWFKTLGPIVLPLLL